MIKEILFIRSQQFKRVAKNLGVFWSLFFVLLVGLLTWVAFSMLQESPSKWMVILVFVSLILSLHLSRKDRKFLKLLTEQPAQIFLIEYLVLSIPLIGLLLVLGEWLPLLLLPLCLLGVSFVNIGLRSRTLNNVFIEAIPDEAFEWKAGVRRYFYPLLIAQLFGLGTCFFVGGAPIAIAIMGLTCLGFYQECESEMLMLNLEQNPQRFIVNKIKTALSLFGVMSLPMMILFLLFHLTYWYVPLILFLVFAFLLTYSILLKYAFYQPNVHKGSTGFWSGMGVLGLLFPPFLLAVFMMSFYFYFKSIRTLKPYLHAFN